MDGAGLSPLSIDAGGPLTPAHAPPLLSGLFLQPVTRSPPPDWPCASGSVRLMGIRVCYPAHLRKFDMGIHSWGVFTFPSFTSLQRPGPSGSYGLSWAEGFEVAGRSVPPPLLPEDAVHSHGSWCDPPVRN